MTEMKEEKMNSEQNPLQESADGLAYYALISVANHADDLTRLLSQLKAAIRAGDSLGISADLHNISKLVPTLARNNERLLVLSQVDPTLLDRVAKAHAEWLAVARPEEAP